MVTFSHQTPAMPAAMMGRRARAAVVLALATTLSVASLTPVAAVVRFEPSPPPAAAPWTADVDVDVPWAGVTMRMPSSWSVSIKREPAFGIGMGASLLVAFGPSDSMCMLEVFDADKVESWQDVGVEPTAALSIDGHRTERFDDIRGLGATFSSAYSVYASGHVYGFFCSADRAPSDRWFSIAETLRLQPIETTEAVR